MSQEVKKKSEERAKILAKKVELSKGDSQKVVLKKDGKTYSVGNDLAKVLIQSGRAELAK